MYKAKAKKKSPLKKKEKDLDILDNERTAFVEPASKK
jgi:hypothetical protein